MLPLSGLVVLDFTTLLPGPMATLMLAEAGAEVIKIERPEGEDIRRNFVQVEGESVPFAMLNAGKRVVRADLKDSNDRDRILGMVKGADIVVEQFRPGVMERLGLGYAAMKAINPGIIYCSITGYGQAGARALEAGHDINYQAVTGLLNLAPGMGKPSVPPSQTADIAGGTLPAVINILLALQARHRSGEGAYIDIAMADAMLTFTWLGMAFRTAFGRAPKPHELALAGGVARYSIYPTKDGRLLACGALEEKFWRGFCSVLGIDPVEHTGIRNVDATKELIASITVQKSAAEWEPLLLTADCCVTVVKTLDEAFADPHFVERGLYAHSITIGQSGKTMTALPLPIAPAFRAAPGAPKGVTE